MRVARHADAPVPLVGDIDRGGGSAHFIGTMLLLHTYESALVKGLAVNKCSRRPSLFTWGIDLPHQHPAVPVATVLSYFFNIHIPDENSLALPSGVIGDDDVAVHIAVVRLPHFDSFDHLLNDPAVLDTDWLQEQGLSERIFCARRDGTPVIGVWAGYQMLGTVLLDPDGVESPTPETRGLGLSS